MDPTNTMLAVVFDGPRKVSVQRRPVPTVQTEGEAIVKVSASGLCGSELHVFRGLETPTPGFIMGHEFTGIVVETGAGVGSVQVGDKVVAPFTTSCLKCFYCRNGHTSRCKDSRLFGSAALDGGQAEYVRVPHADGTLVKAPATISDKALVLMADIWPTGYFGAKSAWELLPMKEKNDVTAVVVGCGPVGLCAVLAATEFKPKNLFAVDAVDSRLEQARQLGAEPLNFKTDPEGMKKRILEVTEGRGADLIIEVVGLSPALRTAFDLIPWNGNDGYGKNIRLQMGRCPVRAIFDEALAVLEKKQDRLEFMFDKMMPLSEAVEGYRMFDAMEVQKVIFTAT
ncbi:related to formaldehyde dehydrogenase [Cephalotrichum gorgonifer]|uniref:Related to formaldehyde dehydrogenase n=1 Tax=Cephalotrichum gorgonifer TaxID=2041049 RepID=A0AAE8MXT3_9PEZI|nr:related to formaldehyde dehydrogenase [Cephalotrichum gorgonifer]